MKSIWAPLTTASSIFYQRPQHEEGMFPSLRFTIFPLSVASLLCTGLVPSCKRGRFVIGPITTTSFVVAFRSERYDWNFRTTDLDKIVVTVSRKNNRLTLVAKSWGDSRVLKADIHVSFPNQQHREALHEKSGLNFSTGLLS